MVPLSALFYGCFYGALKYFLKFVSHTLSALLFRSSTLRWAMRGRAGGGCGAFFRLLCGPSCCGSVQCSAVQRALHTLHRASCRARGLVWGVGACFRAVLAFRLAVRQGGAVERSLFSSFSAHKNAGDRRVCNMCKDVRRHRKRIIVLFIFNHRTPPRACVVLFRCCAFRSTYNVCAVRCSDEGLPGCIFSCCWGDFVDGVQVSAWCLRSESGLLSFEVTEQGLSDVRKT